MAERAPDGARASYGPTGARLGGRRRAAASARRLAGAVESAGQTGRCEIRWTYRQPVPPPAGVYAGAPEAHQGRAYAWPADGKLAFMGCPHAALGHRKPAVRPNSWRERADQGRHLGHLPGKFATRRARLMVSRAINCCCDSCRTFLIKVVTSIFSFCNASSRAKRQSSIALSCATSSISCA